MSSQIAQSPRVKPNTVVLNKTRDKITIIFICCITIMDQCLMEASSEPLLSPADENKYKDQQMNIMQ